jgi:DNA-binding NarL/FixJ family response regulator
MGQCGTVLDLESKSGAGDAARERPRIVLADDHPELLVEIGRRLAVEFDVLCAVGEGFALVKAASELRPDVVISDIGMPGLTGIEACRRILQGGFSRNAILLTMYDDPELVRSALEAGIRGYVLKVDAGEELVSAVKTVLIGNAYLSRRVLKRWTR